VIKARLEGDKAPAPFEYHDKGSMATIGHKHAVADAFGLKLTGLPAYVMWGLVHVAYLIDWGNRLGTLYAWSRALYAINNRGNRVITFHQASDELGQGRIRACSPPPTCPDRKQRWGGPLPSRYASPIPVSLILRKRQRGRAATDPRRPEFHLPGHQAPAHPEAPLGRGRDGVPGAEVAQFVTCPDLVLAVDGRSSYLPANQAKQLSRAHWKNSYQWAEGTSRWRVRRLLRLRAAGRTQTVPGRPHRRGVPWICNAAPAGPCPPAWRVGRSPATRPRAVTPGDPPDDPSARGDQPHGRIGDRQGP
jgi:hypothetical protein